MDARYGLRRTRTRPPMNTGGGNVNGHLNQDIDTEMNGESSTLNVVKNEEEEDERPISDYLVGSVLDDVLAQGNEEDVDVFWPWGVDENGGGSQKVKVDWRGREAIL